MLFYNLPDGLIVLKDGTLATFDDEGQIVSTGEAVPLEELPLTGWVQHEEN